MDAVFPGIAELGRSFRDRSQSPVDVVRKTLERIVELEPALNAFAHIAMDMALADAENARRELADGIDRGPLHGIPIVIKDLIDVAGLPTGWGTRARRPEVAPKDAQLVNRLRAAGAVIVGKTNLLEYAYGIAHPDIGQTNNPHDPSRTAGGSSGGSAAAVAAGIVPVAIGTDTGGSIRIPAAYCGIVGLKPSFGRVPLEGVFPLSQSLDHAGPLTRSVEDAAIVLACLSDRPVPIETHLPQGLRIGLVHEHFASHELNADVAARMQEALAIIEHAGANVMDIEIAGLSEANQALVTILRPEASLIHAAHAAKQFTGYAPGTRAQIEAGFSVAATDYLRAQRHGQILRESVEDTFGTVDVLISPSVPFIAPFEDPVIEDGADGEMLSSGFPNLTGHPALNLPCGTSNGMPIGLQLVGPMRGDARLLSHTRTVERILQMR